jgi:hypothetical protein
MRIKVAFGVFFALLPALAFGQSVQVDGCISGRPCAFGLPLPPPTNTDTYGVDADGCVVGQPCPWRAWRASGSTTTDRLAENVYRTRRNADGTTDVFGSNARTGSQWDQHIDASRNLQFGHNKVGQLWTAPLNTPSYATDEPMEVVFAPSEHDRWLEDWWKKVSKAKSVPPSPPDFDEQKFKDEYAREPQRQLSVFTARMKFRMQDGSIVQAARTAARQRCLALTEVNARGACMKDADQK